ncbi:MAG TPA: hypothetical protein VMH82_02500 [Myxococcota bacterium]|nr:hypothetical protein [Myxococcota bacterium]
MKSTIEQWECPPLRAKLSKHQCERNRRTVAEAQASAGSYDFANNERPMPILRLQECIGCRGVVWWAHRTGRGPVSISIAALREQHLRATVQRKRLAG